MYKGIIAICGSKGAGKDTSYDILKDKVSIETEQLALAGHLKQVCSDVFGIDMKYFTDQSLKEVELEDYALVTKAAIREILVKFHVDPNDPDVNKAVLKHPGKILRTPRRVLQYVGTDILHEIDPLIHVKLAVKLKSKNKLTVITDLRFESEFEYFNNNIKEFTPIYVNNITAEARASIDAHPSETQLHNFKFKCYKIDNNSSIQNLEEEIDKFVENVYKRS